MFFIQPKKILFKYFIKNYSINYSIYNFTENIIIYVLKIESLKINYCNYKLKSLLSFIQNPILKIKAQKKGSPYKRLPFVFQFLFVLQQRMMKNSSTNSKRSHSTTLHHIFLYRKYKDRILFLKTAYLFRPILLECPANLFC